MSPHCCMQLVATRSTNALSFSRSSQFRRQSKVLIVLRPFAMLRFPRFFSRRGHVIPTNHRGIKFLPVHESSESLLPSYLLPTKSMRLIAVNELLILSKQMFDTLTPRWALFLVGGIGLLLAPIPFLAYYFGPEIRNRSPYSKILMAEERKRAEVETMLKIRNDEEIARARTGHSVRRAVSRGSTTMTPRDRSDNGGT